MQNYGQNLNARNPLLQEQNGVANTALSAEDEREAIIAVDELSSGDAELAFDKEDQGYRIYFDFKDDAFFFCKEIADKISETKIDDAEINDLIDSDNSVFLDKPTLEEWENVLDALEIVFDTKLGALPADSQADQKKNSNLAITAQVNAAKAVIEKIASLNNRNFSEELRSDLLKYVIRNYQGGFHALNAPTIKLAGVVEERFQFLLDVFDRIAYESRRNNLTINIGLYNLEVPADCNKKFLKDIAEGACILTKGDKIFYSGRDIDELSEKQFSAALQESHFLKVPFLAKQDMALNEIDHALGNDDKITASYKNFLALDFEYDLDEEVEFDEEDDFEDFDEKKFAVV